MFSDKNAVYLVTAYGVFVGAMLVYGISLWLRRRNVERDEQALDDTEHEDRP